MIQPAEAAARTVVEVGDNAAHWVDPPLARRLVQLEVDDVDVPPPVEAERSSRSPGVYVRIIFHDGRLIVELWDRGELQGYRVLSPSGGKPLTARRIALASGELASRLRESRLFEARRHRREQARLLAERNQPRPPTFEALPAMSAALSAAHVLEGRAWLIGPHLRGGLRLDTGLDLAMGVSLFSGQATELPESVALQAYELHFLPGYWFAVGRDFGLRLGVNATQGVMRAPRATIWSRDGEVETWTARVTGEARGSWALSKSVHLELALEAGAMLRKVQLRTVNDEQHGIGGGWLGASMGVSLL